MGSAVKYFLIEVRLEEDPFDLVRAFGEVKSHDEKM